MSAQLSRETVLAKVTAQEKLTDEEEMFYLTEILGHPEDYAKNILAITKNKDPFTIID